jgi:hypothetical protein
MHLPSLAPPFSLKMAWHRVLKCDYLDICHFKVPIWKCLPGVSASIYADVVLLHKQPPLSKFTSYWTFMSTPILFVPPNRPLHVPPSLGLPCPTLLSPQPPYSGRDLFQCIALCHVAHPCHTHHMAEYILVERRPDLMNGMWERPHCAPQPAETTRCAGKKVPQQKGSDEVGDRHFCPIWAKSVGQWHVYKYGNFAVAFHEAETLQCSLSKKKKLCSAILKSKQFTVIYLNYLFK